MRIQPLVLVAAACCGGMSVACSSSSVEPTAAVSVFVTNTTCASGPCTPLRVLAFPQIQPNTPGGLWSIDLGTVTSAAACLTIPPTATFRVTDAGSGKVTSYVWTSRDSLALGTLPAAALPSQALQSAPTTPEFVPMKATGWGAALPSTLHLVPSGACTA